VQWKHFALEEATSEMEEKMQEAIVALSENEQILRIKTKDVV